MERVETFSGETARRRALAVLVPRYEALEARSKTEFRFSEIELQHMHALRETISQLEMMSPEGELISPTEPPRLVPTIP